MTHTAFLFLTIRQFGFDCMRAVTAARESIAAIICRSRQQLHCNPGSEPLSEFYTKVTKRLVLVSLGCVFSLEAQVVSLSSSVLNQGGGGTGYLSFGPVATNRNSQYLTMLLTNTDPVTSLTVSRLTFSGMNPGEFSETDNCIGTVSPLATCNIVVTFHPTASGSRSATMSIVDDASSTPQTVPLTGTGVANDNSNISQVLTSTCQTNVNNACSGTVTVQATSADAFVNTEGTLFSPTSSYYGFDKVNVLNMGMRHVRSGGAAKGYIAAIKDMAASGLKTQFVDSTNANNYSVDVTQFYSGQGQTTNLLTWLKNTFAPPISNTIDAIEGPNELNNDNEYPITYWHPSDHPANAIDPSSSSTLWLGAYGLAYMQATWLSIKGDPATNAIKVIAPAPVYFAGNPFIIAVGGASSTDEQGYEDWGGCHPYPTAGNGNGVPQTTYDGSAYYNAYTLDPAEEIDQYAQAWTWCNTLTNSGRGTAYGSTPIAPSEEGYPTSPIAKGSISEDIQARYYPRIYVENYRHGMPRTMTYRFDDYCNTQSNSECWFGLMRYDHSLKPAYFAMKSLNTLLQEPGANFSPGTLTYRVAVSANGAFTRTQYMHDLLLEKSNGEFYLLFWHEIADVIKQNNDGSAVVGPAIDLNPLSLPVTFTLPSDIQTATLYTYDAKYNYVPSNLTIFSNQVSVNATDQVQVIRLSPASPLTHTQAAGALFHGSFDMN